MLILQHVAERFHPFNTARIVRSGLRRCEVMVGHNRDFATASLPIQPDAVLLYPSDRSIPAAEIPRTARPSQLVVVDGTWHQAKTIVRDCRQVRVLPRLELTPSRPGRYRIRREPNSQSLSTVEATVQALSLLEPETQGLAQLLDAFEVMVTGQMTRRGEVQGTRQKFRTGGPNDVYPRALLWPASQLVVAYGETTPKLGAGVLSTPRPVNWVAQRLATGDRFECHLESAARLSRTVRDHMRLADVAVTMCSSTHEFRRDWRQFLKPDDVLVVYHARTAQLLQHACGDQPRTLVLKSICGKTPAGSGSLDEVLRVHGLLPASRWGPTRAHQRLAMAVTLAEFFRKRASAGDRG